MIPSSVSVKKNILPESPGVYLMKNKAGETIYVGKAVSLKRRVSSYFSRPHDARIQKMVSEISAIDYVEQPTALDALILEANLIKQYQPHYNIREKDDKSFSYLVITKEEYPRPYVIRGTDLDEKGAASYKAVFGPFTSARAVRNALDLLRKAIPWSTCTPGQRRPCFYASIGLCPGVCTHAVSKREYAKIIRDLIAVFSGKRLQLIKVYRKSMEQASKAKQYEEAARFRDRLYALEHIRDIALLAKDDRLSLKEADTIPVLGRVEGYDLSNISGTSAVGSMVVFKKGAPAKALYRSFRIRTVIGPDDYASLKEVLRRRFKHRERGWEWPDLILIDGGIGQVHAALSIIQSLEAPRTIPVIGIAKGPRRDKDELVIPPAFIGLKPILNQYKEILVAIRDESHRFAIGYHRRLRGKIK